VAKLFWLQPDNTIIEFPLAAEQNVIGRGGRSDIRIKHPGISAEHALIRVVDTIATIEDLDSTNGTRVNGRTVRKHTLRHGDQIEVGRERLMFFAELDSASRYSQPEPDTPYSEPGAQSETVRTKSAPAPTPPPAPAVVRAKPAALHGDVAFDASITILSGANTGKRVALDKPTMTLGREGQQVIAIERASANEWRLRLTQGATPPYINGDAILDARALASGDVIELIGIKLRFDMSVA
jgi:FHA domain